MAHLRGAVVRLEDARALDEATTGGKAAALARAAWAQLPVLPGFVLTTAATALVDETGDVAALGSDVERAWAELSEDGRRALVVRSSSTVEDLADSSMAGRFKSVVGVKGLEPFLEAVKVVLDSRREAARGDTDIPADHPIAVLVQPLLEARCGGVMFGVDPVTGREDRIVVSAVEGGPDRLVSGEVDATRYELDPKGRVRSCQERPGGASLGRRQRRRLAELARRAALVFDGPQDIEWALDGDGRLWLLQSRPVTTEVSGTPSGALLGPGPVAETFPEPLSRLEEDLWVEPLRRALREALLLAGSASRRDLEASPLAVCVGGRVAVDLSLFGAGSSERSMWRRIDPRPKLRRLPAAWRVGRLRSALPGLGADLVAKTDAELAGIPPLDELTDRQLVTLLERGAQALVALHAHEILVGVLVDPGAPRLTGTSVALRVLARSRQEGLADEEIVVRHPVVLALVPPHVRPVAPLPAEVDAPPEAPSGDADDLALLREALRLRVRWLQELTGRAAWELGRRLHDRGVVADPSLVRHLRLEAVQMVLRGRAAVLHREGERAEHPESDEGALPTRFQLTEKGKVVPVAAPGGAEAGGTGAGGGRARGRVHHSAADAPEGAVLVVRTLDPQLASALPRLAGLVAETGSVLAHVAILAREYGVPTVVGVADAHQRYPEGSLVSLDGTTGEVRLADEEEREAAP